MSEEKFAIRFGLGAVKAVGFAMMEKAVLNRKEKGKFKDIYDFATRLDPKSINKKSIEALAKAGAFDSLSKNRRQIAESFDILSSFASGKKEEATSNQMNLFAAIPEMNANPALKNVTDWKKSERLQKEFEAFGYFLNEHPIDDYVDDLKRRGVIFSKKIEEDELEDGSLVKMAGVVAYSRHRSSSARGRFAYFSISDSFGIFEANIFDEALITATRDILVDGSAVALECLIRKDDGGTRILIRDVKRLNDFIITTRASDRFYEDIKKRQQRRQFNGQKFQKKSDGGSSFSSSASQSSGASFFRATPAFSFRNIFTRVEIVIESKDAITAVKHFLSTCETDDNEKFTKVFLMILHEGKYVKADLAQKYKISTQDLEKIRKIEGIRRVDGN